ncbi:DUF2142 domain-containing protein [Ramlibacter sp.]|uniref:DUF2142 domain-containing protein n=1 Tax=Ramlibacter sp. TaxID=1917967 RepID=UPI003D0BC6B0
MRFARALAAWLAVLLGAIALSALIPPLQSPDEHSHIFRGYALSKGRVALETPPGESTGSRFDEGILYFVRPYLLHIVGEKTKRLTPADEAFAKSQTWQGKEHFFSIPGAGYYFPAVYTPHALAFGIGQALDLSVAHTYRLTRALCIVAGLALLALAMRVQRPPPLAAALLLLPMTLFQLVLPTIDGITTSAAALALALFMRRSLGDGDAPAWHAWALAASLFLLATTRVHLTPLLVLPFVLYWRFRTRRDLWLGLAVAAASLAWTLYALAHTVDARIKRDHGTTELLLHYARHPLDFFRVVAASFTDEKLSTFYSQSFIGILGWLDTIMRPGFYVALWIGLALCAGASLAGVSLRRAAPERLLLAGAAVASVLLAFFALLVTWTPHPAATVEGVQGRYFIVPALAVAYAFAAAPHDRPRRWATYGLPAAFGALSLYALIATLLARYH